MTECLERIITEQENKWRAEAAEHAAAAAAWKAVTRNRKKDGGDFAHLPKNFNDCRFVNQYGTDYLYVYYKVGHRYSNDCIYISGNLYREAIDTADKVEAAITAAITRHTEEEAKCYKAAEDLRGSIASILHHMDAIKTAFSDIYTEYGIGKEYDVKEIVKNYLR